jgi:hypothetical protein
MNTEILKSRLMSLPLRYRKYNFRDSRFQTFSRKVHDAYLFNNLFYLPPSQLWKTLGKASMEWEGLNLHMFGAQLCSPAQKSAHKITEAIWRTKILVFQSCLKLVKALVSCAVLSFSKWNFHFPNETLALLRHILWIEASRKFISTVQTHCCIECLCVENTNLQLSRIQTFINLWVGLWRIHVTVLYKR